MRERAAVSTKILCTMFWLLLRGPAGGQAPVEVPDPGARWFGTYEIESAVRQVVATRDGGAAFIPRVDEKGRVFRVSATGEVMWSAQSGLRVLWTLLAARDGGFYAGGVDATANGRGLLVRLTSEGEVVWERRYTNPVRADVPVSRIRNLSAFSNGDLFVTGNAQGDSVLFRLSPDGDFVWTRSKGAGGAIFGHSLRGDRAFMNDNRSRWLLDPSGESVWEWARSGGSTPRHSVAWESERGDFVLLRVSSSSSRLTRISADGRETSDALTDRSFITMFPNSDGTLQILELMDTRSEFIPMVVHWDPESDTDDRIAVYESFAMLEPEELTYSGTAARTPDGGFLVGVHGTADGVLIPGLVKLESPSIGPSLSPFRRGDCDNDGSVNVTDAVCALNWAFLEGPRPGCVAATDGTGDGRVDLSDAVYLLNYAFLNGPTLAAPFPDCGLSELETDSPLGCQESVCV